MSSFIIAKGKFSKRIQPTVSLLTTKNCGNKDYIIIIIKPLEIIHVFCNMRASQVLALSSVRERASKLSDVLFTRSEIIAIYLQNNGRSLMVWQSRC